MDKNNNKKRKNLIQEFLTYTGSDPSTNEIIGFLAIKNAEYLAKNEANHGQFSKEERKDLYEFYNYFAEHFEKQTRDARLRNWGQEPYLFRLTIDLYEWEQQELKNLSEELPEKNQIRNGSTQEKTDRDSQKENHQLHQQPGGICIRVSSSYHGRREGSI